MPDRERQEPAISGYDMRFDDPRMNPIAFLPVDDLSQAVRYGEFTDWRGPQPDPPSATAGEEDHSDPARFVGPDADPPVNP